ncbi:MAG: DUF624 domain-containing protein [Clostridia bacterium]|nr:DUF624 domain-containing protein [Clostridia bacterium]
MAQEKIFEAAPEEQLEDDRSGLKIFSQVLVRKFWKLISINLMYLLCNLPAVLVSLVISAYMVQLFLPNIVNTGTQTDILAVLFMSAFPIMMLLMAIPVVSVGPAQAGLTYLMRCFSYELPVFSWMDFKEKMKENLKQGLAVTFINLFIIVFLIIDLYLYSSLKVGSSILFPIANGLSIVVFAIFLMMCLYLYPMMVSYSLRLKDLYKNAFLFAFAKFIPNLLVLILCGLLIIGPLLIVQLTATILSLLIVYVYYLLLGFTLPGLVINFFINPTIDKYLRPAQPVVEESKVERES